MSESLELTSPDSIVVEYLHSRDPEVRRNAATAAGVLATEETMTCLVEIALHDEDPKVRESAVAELIRLGERLNQVSTNVLAPKLRDRRERAATYALLGKLKNHGVQLTLPAFSFKKRLAMAWTLFPSLYAKKLVKLRRAIKPASLGALLGLLIALIVGGFSLAMSLGTELLLGILGIGAMSIPVAALVSSRATPLALHYYRAAGLVAEVLAAAAGSAAAMVPLELPAVVALFAGKPGMFIRFSEFTSATIVWAVFVRIGTAIAPFRRPHKTLRHGVRIGSGFLAGVLATLVTTLAISMAAGQGFEQLLIALSLLFFPPSMALACCYAKVEQEAEEENANRTSAIRQEDK